jgi:AcrR family transcriptional regulator
MTPPRPHRKRPGRYHHGDLRRALIDTALKMIEQEGVAAVTTRALARRLGVSHAAPGHHFHDRDALLIEVATEGFRAFADALEAAARGPDDPEEKLVAIGRAYVRFACAHSSHVEVMFARDAHEGHPDRAALEEESERAYRVLTGAIEAVVASRPGPQPRPSVDELAFGFWALVHGMATLWIGGLPPGPEAALRPKKPAGSAADLAALEAAAERAIRRAISGVGVGSSR